MHEASRLDVRGAAAITDLAHNVCIVRRSRDKEKEVQDFQSRGMAVPSEVLERPDAVLICDKNREGEWEGRHPLWFHLDSLQYLEAKSSVPTLYVRRLNTAEFQTGRLWPYPQDYEEV
ncbi:MAG: hypothetical protein AABO41_07630 [Acidobacteriota bacterium]